MKIISKRLLIAVFILGVGFLGIGTSFYAHRNASRADGGAPPPPPIPLSPTPKQTVMIADGGAPPPPPIPWSVA